VIESTAYKPTIEQRRQEAIALCRRKIEEYRDLLRILELETCKETKNRSLT